MDKNIYANVEYTIYINILATLHINHCVINFSWKIHKIYSYEIENINAHPVMWERRIKLHNYYSSFAYLITAFCWCKENFVVQSVQLISQL